MSVFLALAVIYVALSTGARARAVDDRERPQYIAGAAEYVTSDTLLCLGLAVMPYVRRKSFTLESWLLPPSRCGVGREGYAALIAETNLSRPLRPTAGRRTRISVPSMIPRPTVGPQSAR